MSQHGDGFLEPIDDDIFPNAKRMVLGAFPDVVAIARDPVGAHDLEHHVRDSIGDVGEWIAFQKIDAEIANPIRSVVDTNPSLGGDNFD